jgi:hypothetical protein
MRITAMHYILSFLLYIMLCFPSFAEETTVEEDIPKDEQPIEVEVGKVFIITKSFDIYIGSTIDAKEVESTETRILFRWSF